jgi:hypothetical protein
LLQELDEPGGVETVFHELTSSKPELKLFDETPPELRDVFSGRVRLSTDEMRKALGVPLKRVLDKQNLMRTEAYEQYMGFAEQEAWAVEVRAREEAERALLPTKS